MHLGPTSDVACIECDIQLSTALGRGSELEAPFSHLKVILSYHTQPITLSHVTNGEDSYDVAIFDWLHKRFTLFAVQQSATLMSGT